MIITKTFCRMLANTKDVNCGDEAKPVGETGGDVRQQAATDAIPKAQSPQESS
jgi:hypothetical protein